MRNSVSMLTVMIFTVLPICPAIAAEPCPPEAEQNLFNLTLMARAGKVKDATEVYRHANTALEICADRSAVQGLATELFAMVGQTVKTPEDRLLVYSKAWESAANNDRAYKSSERTKVKLPDGTEHSLYPYAATRALLRQDIMPKLLRAANEGAVHPMFTDTSLAECPYSAPYGSRAVDEAEGMITASYSGQAEEVDRIDGRISRLAAACPKQAADLTFQLGELYYKSANTIKYQKDPERHKAYIALAKEHYRNFQYNPTFENRNERLKDLAQTRQFHLARETTPE